MPGTLPLRRFDVVIADIDGCLIAERSTPFDLDALSLVRAHNQLAIERGDRPIVTVCSGRPQPFAEAMCRLLGNELIPCVCENGVWTYHPGTNRYEMDPSITCDHLEAVRELSAWGRETFGSRGVTEQPGKNASVTFWHADTRFLTDVVFPAAAARCQERAWPFRVSMTWLYINCDLAHINKGTGIDRAFGPLGIARGRLAGIGDTPGDKPIADRVGFFACPSNAHAAIREHAHMIASKPEAQGVVEILAHLVG